MKHFREDYNRIQDPAGLIPENEPVFLLRAQDKNAPSTLRYWAQMAMMDKNYEMAIMILKGADEMEQWQKEVKVKQPDLKKN